MAGEVRAVFINSLKAENVITFVRGLNQPNGLAMRNGSLYVAEISRIIIFDDIESTLKSMVQKKMKDAEMSAEIQYRVWYKDFPNETHHGWKFIRFSPDGDLFVPVGAPCNVCYRDDPRFSTSEF